VILHPVVDLALVKAKMVSSVLIVELQSDYHFYDPAYLLILKVKTFVKMQTEMLLKQFHFTYGND
jgi:hypothetical protein